MFFSVWSCRGPRCIQRIFKRVHENLSPTIHAWFYLDLPSFTIDMFNWGCWVARFNLTIVYIKMDVLQIERSQNSTTQCSMVIYHSLMVLQPKTHSWWRFNPTFFILWHIGIDHISKLGSYSILFSSIHHGNVNWTIVPIPLNAKIHSPKLPWALKQWVNFWKKTTFQHTRKVFWCPC